ALFAAPGRRVAATGARRHRRGEGSAVPSRPWVNYLLRESREPEERETGGEQQRERGGAREHDRRLGPLGTQGELRREVLIDLGQVVLAIGAEVLGLRDLGDLPQLGVVEAAHDRAPLVPD